MRTRITLVAAVVGLAACHHSAAPEERTAEPRAVAVSDSGLLRLCASVPETTSTGSVGCVLKDQSRRLPVKKDPPR